MEKVLSFELFRAAACVVLGGVVGALIGLSASLNTHSPYAAYIPVVTLLLGILSGYRRRNSVAFFYFSLVCVCALSALLSSYGIESGAVAP